METALRVKRSQPCERRGSFLLLPGRRKLLPAVEGRGVEWETQAREGWLQTRCGSAEQAPPGDRAWGEQETPVLALAAAVVAL